MTKIYIPKGDKGFNLSFTIRDSNGNAYDISTYTVTLKLWRKGLPGTVVQSGARTFYGQGNPGYGEFKINNVRLLNIKKISGIEL
jgi:hypothetical protein